MSKREQQLNSLTIWLIEGLINFGPSLKVNMKTTRYHDLAFLETARDKTDSEKLKRKLDALLIDVYEQSKDGFLEKARVKLEGLIKRKLTTTDKFENAKIDAQVKKLRERVEAYAKSPAYINRQLKKINKVSSKEAEVKYKKLTRRN
jgi:hypothetical protein